MAIGTLILLLMVYSWWSNRSFLGLGGSSWKNRQDGLGMVIRNFKKGDQLSALIETNYMGEVNSTGIKSATLIKIG